MQNILASKAVGISELKANPAAVLSAAEFEPVAILNRNKPAGYLISPAAWEAMVDRLEDLELLQIANERMNGKTIKVNLDDL